MMDLSVVYSKTAKGLRARTSLIGGLSSHLMRVLTHVDGTLKAEMILVKYDQLSEQELAVALTQLESQGYIKPIPTTISNNDDWAPTTNFTPMVVEEFQTVEEIEAKARAVAEEQARLEAERKAKAEAEAEQIRIKAIADEKAKEKARAEAKVNARLEADRIAREAEEAQKKAEAEAKAKVEAAAKLEAARKAKAAEQVRLAAERQAKMEEKARQKAERKAQEEAEQLAHANAKEKANADAKENARREIERIALEAIEEQKRSEAEARVIAEKTRLEAERKAKAEEARLETERKAKADAEAEQIRAKAEAERKAQEEAEQVRAKAEAKAKLEAEEKAKIEAKENARREIERVVRKAEEDRKKSEAKAKEARQEAKRKAKAEEEARLKAERKAKLDAEQMQADALAEEKARAGAKENARIEMERFAREAEEERKKSAIEARSKAEEARLEAERKAQAEAEHIRAKVEAEEKVLAEAKENSRLEMERISLEADELRKKSIPETQTKVEVVAHEVTKPRSWEEIEQEEERAFEEEEHISKDEVKVDVEVDKISQQEAEKLGRVEIKRAAKEEAEANSKAQGRKSSIDLDIAKWAALAIKVVLVYLPLVVLLLIGLMPFFNIGMLVAPIEKLASESVGETVTIEQVHVSLWPQPHITLGNIAIGANPSLKTDGMKIEALHVLPETSTLFEEVKMVESLEFEGVKINQDNFGQPQQWINNLSKAQGLKVAQINLKKVVLEIRDLELGTFDGKVELAESRELERFNLNNIDHTLSAQITPQGSSFDVALTGTNWPLPINPKVVFGELKARGTLNQSQINFSQIEGNIYGGSIKAKAVVDWSNEWSAAGNFDLSNATLPQMLSTFGSGASIDGKLELVGTFSCRSAQAAKLVDGPEIVASFEARDGKINGVDLTLAVLSRSNQSLTGEPTHFDTLTGNVLLNNGYYQYRQLALETAQFHAKGNMDIQPNQDISGKISADLAAESRRLQARFSLAGRVGDVQRQ